MMLDKERQILKALVLPGLGVDQRQIQTAFPDPPIEFAGAERRRIEGERGKAAPIFRYQPPERGNGRRDGSDRQMPSRDIA